MSLGHFVKHLTCYNAQLLWRMREQIEKCLNTNLKCLKGPTQMHQQQMGLSPIKILENFSKNWVTQPFFEKIPNFENSKLKSAKLKEKWKQCLEKHTLKWFWRDLCLKMMGYEWKMILGWEGFKERQCEGKSKCLKKNCHVCIIKLKTRAFHGLGNSETITRKSRDILKLPRIASSRDTVAIASIWNLEISSFCLKTIRKKSLVVKYSGGSSETFYMKMWLFNFL